MASSSEQGKGELTAPLVLQRESSSGGLFHCGTNWLGLCWADHGDALSTFETIAPVEIDPLL